VTAAQVTRPQLPGPALVPRPFRVLATRVETADTTTITLEPADGLPLSFAAGQFTMIGTFGGSEAPVSVTSSPAAAGPIEQTIRDMGGVTHDLARAQPGDMLTVRGPYGTGWNITDGSGGDLVIVAGGIGLAPLRSALLQVLADRAAYRRVCLIYGARSPAERVFRDDLARWAAGEGGIAVDVTVDRADPGWPGRVGLVTHLITDAAFDPARTLALVCGPEVMMRLVAAALTDAGVPAARIRVSLERNMKCGVGLCGHCQLRDLFICTDGPVLPYERVAGLMALREC
jgi:NAD(P)H-flavin reductase